MIAVFLLCLVAVTVAQRPVPCSSPPQWESRLFDSNEQQHASLRGRISYDSVYHRTRIVENIDVGGQEIAFDILTLFDDKVEFIFDVKHGKCTRLPINQPWRDFGIPPDAQSLGEAYLGSSAVPGGGLLVTMWSSNVTLPTNETVSYIGTWTSEGCLPVSTVTISPKYGNGILSFYDLTTGISDPYVFIPSLECLTTIEYALRHTLFGKPVKKDQ